MADFFDSEEVVKGYDSKIAYRILSYLKPHKTLIAITAVALVLSTIGELFVPLLQQRIIDDAIVVRFHTVKHHAAEEGAAYLSDESRAALALFKAHPRAMEAGDFHFIPLDRNTRVSAGIERELRERGILDGGTWYAFRFAPDSRAAELTASRPDIFRAGEGAAGILTSDLNTLPIADIAAVRADDICVCYTPGTDAPWNPVPGVFVYVCPGVGD
ncbi:MAG: hypothetical protein FWB99_07305 [Treponema sp.]|nr:hypothetical protein [Treponema sp.]